MVDVLDEQRLRADAAGVGDDGGAVGTVRLPAGEQTGDHGDDEQHRGTGEQGSQPAVLAGLLAQPLFGRRGLGSFPLGAGVEEGPFGWGEVGVGTVLPVEGLGEADAAVELAVGPAHAVPGVGGEGEVAQDALTLDVVVQPGLQAGPGPGERFVGQLDGLVVAGHQPGPRPAAR